MPSKVKNNIRDRPREEITLSRDLSLFTITMIGVGGMIGAGIFVLTGIAAGVAGPALVLAFALNGLVTTLTAMSYAELGSAFPEAGGGYLWVKEALGGAQGFLAGWMSWFAHAVAGSLYAIAFGRFSAELMLIIGFEIEGFDIQFLSRILMTLIIILFTAINYRGASETGTIGNIVTLTKVGILGIFTVFGIVAMTQNDAWMYRFTEGFMPNGIFSVFIAMGLTFIAFEGYEIIAQSGEEVVDPKRTIPRAIFMAIGIAVVIYLLVGVTVIGAATAPEGLRVYEYLGLQKETAVVEVAKQVMPWGIGGVVLLISSLASTMSALNATTYSSSRVSFAMGRDHNLPAVFAKIHPVRYTPYWAVFISGIFMILMGWLLPIEDVAAATDIMFLILFLQVNLALMYLRHQRPDLDRGFKVPLFPLLPIIAMISNAALAVQLFSFSPIAWFFAIGWVVIGLLSYYMRFSKIEAMEKPSEILHEEVLVSRDYSVLIPVVSREQSRILGDIGSIIAAANQGEVLALHVVQVPPQLTLGEGRIFLKEGRVYLDEVIQRAQKYNVPVHTIIRLGRNVANAIHRTAIENATDLIVLGWPGYTTTTGKLFGSVTDPIVDNPPTDVVVVRYRQRRPLRKVLVPVSGGPNARRAVKLAVNMAQAGEEGPAKVTILHILPVGATDGERIRGENAIKHSLEGIEYGEIETRLVEGADLAETIIEQSENCDLIIIGASEEPIFKNLLVGTMPERIARKGKVTVMMVKRRSGPLHSFVRRAILDPTIPKPLD